MRIARHVVARKDQWLVALPAQLRARLGLTPGAMVWWHIGKKRQATLTVSGRVRAGRPAIDEDCPTCAKLRAEVDRQRRQLGEGDAASAGQYFKAGYMRALGDVGNVKYDVELALTLLKELLTRVPLRGAAREAPAKHGPRRARARAVEVVEAPVLAEGEAREQIDAAVARFGPGIGFGLDDPAPAERGTERE